MTKYCIQILYDNKEYSVIKYDDEDMRNEDFNKALFNVTNNYKKVDFDNGKERMMCLLNRVLEISTFDQSDSLEKSVMGFKPSNKNQE